MQEIQKAKSFASNILAKAAEILRTSEQMSKQNSVALRFDKHIADLDAHSKKIKDETFQIVILGDFNRGKSSLINALLGVELLPTKIIPCTAVVTKIIYGQQTRVTIYYNNGQPAIVMNLADFKRQYIIPIERKAGQNVFTSVREAVIEYPHELLRNGITLVDTPGLNEDKNRNQLTLNALQNSQLVLFVLNTIHLLEMQEQDYIQRYLTPYWQETPKGRLPNIFFAINAWDTVAAHIPKGEHQAGEIKQAEIDIRKVCANRLGIELGLTLEEIKPFWKKRIFETSALKALECIAAQKAVTGTGVEDLYHQMEDFLKEDRLRAEFEVTFSHFNHINREIKGQLLKVIPSLHQNAAQLKLKMKDAQPHMQMMATICQEYKQRMSEERPKIMSAYKRMISNFYSQLIIDFEHAYSDFEANAIWGFKKAAQEKYIHTICKGFEVWFAKKNKKLIKQLQTGIPSMTNLQEKQENAFQKYQEQVQAIQKIFAKQSEQLNYQAAQPNQKIKLSEAFGMINPSGLADDKITLSGFNSIFKFISGFGLTATLLGGAAKVGLGVVTGGTSLAIEMVAGSIFAAVSYYTSESSFKEKLKNEVETRLKSKIRLLQDLITGQIDDFFIAAFENMGHNLDQLVAETKREEAVWGDLMRKLEKNQIDGKREEERLKGVLNQLNQCGMAIQELIEKTQKNKGNVFTS